MSLTRRSLVQGVCASGLLSAVAHGRPVPRGVLLRGADVVLTGEGPAREGCDVLVRGDRIAGVGENLERLGAEVIDCRGHVVMPGLVDTHWHMWNAAARGLSSSSKGGFWQTQIALANEYTPEDSAIGVRLALAEAVNAGITTVHNWAHNTRSPAHARAELAAMRDAGVRGRYSYGYPQDLPATVVMDVADLQRVAREWRPGLLTLGVCTRGPDRSTDATWRAEWAAARSLGLPVTTHVAYDAEAEKGKGIARLQAAGCLGPDVQLVHLTAATRSDFELVVRSGSPISISPWTELAVGFGVTPVLEMVSAGQLVGLSVDTLTLAGDADMFSIMKLTADLGRALGRKQDAITDDAIMRWASFEGARSLGFSDGVGKIRVGGKADLIAVDLTAIGMVPRAGVATAVIDAARSADVTTVMIDGVVRKRDGRLVGVDLAKIRRDALRSIDRMRNSAGVGG